MKILKLAFGFVEQDLQPVAQTKFEKSPHFTEESSIGLVEDLKDEDLNHENLTTSTFKHKIGYLLFKTKVCKQRAEWTYLTYIKAKASKQGKNERKEIESKN